MDTSLQKRFREQGYIHFKALISPEEITAMREAGERYFTQGRTHMFTRDFVRIAPLAALPFRPRVVAAIRSVFGDDYATISQFSMSANLHNPQWHRDSQSQQGNDYLYDPDYMIAKCAVYLQDNDPEWGGGMEIVPRSHLPGYLGYRSPFQPRSLAGRVTRRLQSMAHDLRDRKLEALWLPAKAGDVLLFHANLIHRASQPHPSKARGGYKNVALVNPPREKFKFLIDWEASPDNRYLPVYLAHQARRAAADEALFDESLRVRFPEDYEPELVRHIRALGLRIAHYNEQPAPEKEAA